MKMSTSQLLKSKKNSALSLFKNYYYNPANMLISRWLREMDGENTEEDPKIRTNYSKLDGQNSSPSFKKVFRYSPSAIYNKW